MTSSWIISSAAKRCQKVLLRNAKPNARTISLSHRTLPLLRNKINSKTNTAALRLGLGFQNPFRGNPSTAVRAFSSSSGDDDGDDVMQSERESMPFDVLIVGGGPSGLAASIRLKQLCEENEVDLSVCVIEKGR